MKPSSPRLRGRPRLPTHARVVAVLLPLILSLPLVACDGEERPEAPERGEQPPEDRAAIDSVYHRFSRAYTLLEADSVADLYTEDALYLPATGDVIRGRPAIRANFDNFFRSVGESGSRLRISFVTLDRRTGGDLAYDVGYYTLESGPAGMIPTVSRGKFTTVWRKGLDGVWRIHVDAFSPAPPDTAADRSDTTGDGGGP